MPATCRWTALFQVVVLVRGVVTVAAAPVLQQHEAAPSSSSSLFWGTNELARHVLDAHARARCNDGMPAAYYSDMVAKNRRGDYSKVLVLLQGGGQCYNLRSCTSRVATMARAKTGENGYMQGYDETRPSSVEMWPKRLAVTGVLSTSKSVNPVFHDWLHVFIPYCSSDMHTGRTCETTASKTQSTPSDTALQSYNLLHTNATATGFCGAYIVDAVLDELYGTLKEFKQVVLAGLSAGGVGAVYHTSAWRRRLPASVDVKVLADSAWFPAVSRLESYGQQDGSGVQEQRHIIRDAAKAWGTLPVNSACEADAVARVGRGDSARGACLLLEFALPHLNVPAWIFQGLYDAYFALPETGRLSSTFLSANTVFSNLNFVLWLQEYGEISRHALERALIDARSANHSIFAPSCVLHGTMYHSARSLTRELPVDRATGLPDWKGHVNTRIGKAPRQVDVRRSTAGMDFAHLAKDPARVLNDMRIGNTYALDHLAAFVNGKAMSMTLDNCSTVNCNPTCGAAMRLPYETAPSLEITADSSTFEVFVAILSIVVIAGSFLLDFLASVLGLLRVRTWTRVFEAATPAREHMMGQASQPATGDVELGAVIPRKTIRVQMSLQVHDESADLTQIPYPIQLLRLTYVVPDRKDKTKEISLLNDVTLDLRGSGLVAVMGASGCGKSTLIELICGRRKTGTMRGVMLRNSLPSTPERDAALSDTMGYVPQFEFSSYPSLTVYETLLYEMCCSERFTNRNLEWCSERVFSTLKLVQLEQLAGTRVGGGGGTGGLSGGQRRRLSVAKELLHRPVHLIADEPTSGLDASSTIQLVDSLYNVSTHGHSLTMTIHQPREEAFESFTTLIIMTKGRVAYCGGVVPAIKHFNELLLTYIGVGEGATMSNPANMIIDVVTNLDKGMQRAIVEKNIPHQKEQQKLVLDEFLSNIALSGDNLDDDEIAEALEPLAQEYTLNGSYDIAPPMEHDEHDDKETFQHRLKDAKSRIIRNAAEAKNSLLHGKSWARKKAQETAERLQNTLEAMRAFPMLRKLRQDRVVMDMMQSRAISRQHTQLMEARKNRTWRDGLVAFSNISATVHGRLFHTLLHQGISGEVVSSYMVTLTVTLIIGITFWDIDRGSAGLLNGMTAYFLFLLFPPVSRLMLLDNTARLLANHRVSRGAGNEESVHFALSLSIFMNCTSWIFLAMATLLFLSMTGLPTTAWLQLVLVLVLSESVMAAMLSVISAVMPNSMRFVVGTFAGMTNGWMSGAVVQYGGMHAIYRWIAWITPSSYARCLGMIALFSGRRIDCDGDGNAAPPAVAGDDGTAPQAGLAGSFPVLRNACQYTDAFQILQQFSASDAQLAWVIDHMFEALLILLVQLLFWRAMLIVVLYAEQIVGGGLKREPYSKLVYDLLQACRGNRQISETAVRAQAARTLQTKLFLKKYQNFLEGHIPETYRVKALMMRAFQIEGIGLVDLDISSTGLKALMHARFVGACNDYAMEIKKAASAASAARSSSSS